MTTLMVLVVLMVGTGQSPSDLPSDLEHLKALVKDEASLLDAVRTYDQEQTATAEAEMEQAGELARSGDGEAAKAKHEQAAQRFQSIRKAYEFLESHYNKNARAKTYYGELLYDRFGEEAGALKEWQLAIALDPEFSTPYNDLGIHYCHVGQYKQGLNYYDKALSLDPKNPDYLFNMVQTYLLNPGPVGDSRGWDKARVYKEAMKLSKKSAQLAPDDYELVVDYAVNFYAAENFGVEANWREAAAAWREARAVARDDVERFYCWLNEGRVEKNRGDTAKARACVEQALKLNPGSEVAQHLIRELSRMEKNQEKNRGRSRQRRP